ncbi:MAG TPA: hypothetical protein VHU40_00985 [Polyangia bacterium]|jgi:hypothetical protein|nr:hypothetical protein [Polyangia bacterium]
MANNDPVESFFKDEVERAFKAEGLQVADATGPYLARLLTTYAAQPIENRPLGVRFFEALAAGPRERRSSLREIGDTSLFLSGYWGDSLGGKLVDVDYYIDLGGMAYSELARDQDTGAGRDVVGPGGVFSELATHFSRFVEVLMTISRRTTRGRSDRDVVRLYERWLRTKSRWAARRLAEEGVIARALATKGTLH